MAIKKAKKILSKPKIETVVAHDAFLSLIKKYKNTSVIAGAFVLALTSFMGIKAINVYTTKHDHPDTLKSADWLGYTKSASVKEETPVPQDTTASSPQVNGAVTTQGTVNTSGNSTNSNASPNGMLNSSPTTQQLERDHKCSSIPGVQDNKFCDVNSPAPAINY